VPRTTVAYIFEWKMLEAVVTRAGDDLKPFRHDQDGVHIFYDPFDPPEYRWLEWSGLPRATAEKLLGVAFEPRDFVHFSTKESIDFPAAWDVMF
jgi:hypothetical protein